MNDEILACLASHIRYFHPNEFAALRMRLAAGERFANAIDDLHESSAIRAHVIGRSDELYDHAQSTWQWCCENEASVLHPWHADYPAAFLNLEKPPIFLSMIGRAVWKERLGLAIVGSREPTSAALEWMDLHLPVVFRSTPLYTVSGGARGIDQRAHALSLRSHTPTVAFLPSGLAHAYPRGFSSWFEKIKQTGGAVISEFSPQTEMSRQHFERRNRMIASLSCGLFVVEAARKSGSQMTARLALQAGRTVCALPSGPMDPRSAGTLDLLFDGAAMIRNASDLLEFVALNATPVEA